MKHISLIIALMMNITLISAQEEIKLYPKGPSVKDGRVTYAAGTKQNLDPLS